MKRLLLFEWYKIRNYRLAWGILGSYVFGTLGTVWLLSRLSAVKVSGGQLPVAGLFNYPQVWSNSTAIMIVANVLLLLLVALCIANGFESRLLRQHVMEGMSRNEIFGGQVLFNSVLSTLTVLLALGIAVIFGRKGEGPYWSIINLQHMGGLFLYTFVRLSFIQSITLFCKRAMPSILAWLIWGFTETILGLFFEASLKIDASNYLPSKVIHQLLPLPTSHQELQPIAGHIFATSFGYGLLFAFISWWQLRRIDL